MPSLTTLFAANNRTVRIAEVTGDLGNGSYLVSIGGKTIRVRSSIGATLKSGAEVIIADTGNGMFIVGEEKGRGRNRQEVVIDG